MGRLIESLARPRISEAESAAAAPSPAKPSRVVRAIRIVVPLRIVFSFHVDNYAAVVLSVTERMTPTRAAARCNQSTAASVVPSTPGAGR